MAIDYLEDIEKDLERGMDMFACPSINSGDWVFSKDMASILPKAKRAAQSKKHELNIYRLASIHDASMQDGFLIVRKFLEPNRDGSPRMQWAMVDSKEASEMMRDVSQGPSPYFAALIEETVMPEE